MRYPIWKKDDFFATTDEDMNRIDMDASIVELPDTPIPVAWMFSWERPPFGSVTDLRCENGEITGEFEFYSNQITQEQVDEMLEELYRFGGWYKGVSYDDDKKRILTARLMAVSFVATENVPGFPKKVQQDG